MLVLFFAVWMLLNGRPAPDTVLLGLAVSALLYWFCCRFLRYSFRRDRELLRKLGKFFRLLLVLVREIVKANFALLPYIYGAGRKPEPVVARFTAHRVTTQAGRVLLANCITLTLGTITGSLVGGDYLVHCLDRSMASELEDSAFVNAIQEWEEK